MKIGYARVSTDDQTTALQLDALKAEGCDRIFTDEGVSGAKASRPEWDKCLDHLREGDTLIVWRLDRAGRSMKNLIEVFEELKARGIKFMSIQEGLGRTDAEGELLFHVMAAFAQYEKSIISNRTKEGLAAARARGRKGGRKKSVNKAQQLEAQRLYDVRELSVSDICKEVGISRGSFYRYVETENRTVTQEGA